MIRFAANGQAPPAGVPREMADVWFRFHELQLCQDLDVVFVFHPAGLEIWCRVEEERAYDRFVQLLDPLRASFRIESYVTKPATGKSSEDRDPPPSVWNNKELLDRLTPGMSAVPPEPRMLPSPEDTLMKQRILMFVRDTLEWNKRMRRYAGELPALVSGGYAPAAAPETRQRAAALSVAHARELSRSAGKVREAMVQCLPQSPKAGTRRPALSKLTPADAARQLSELVQETGRRVYSFFYPQDYTVDLQDLKEPSLLYNLQDIRSMAAEFEVSLTKASAAK